MKKAGIVLNCLLFVLIVLFPAGALVSTFFGFMFELINVVAFSAFLAVLSVCTVIVSLITKNTVENKTVCVLLAVIPLASLVNAVFCVFKCSTVLVLASAVVTVGCCCFLSVKYGKPLTLKKRALVLSGLMVLPAVFVSFMCLFFGNIGQDTVVQSVESPSGKYYAEVIDSNQGALGGDTIVVAYEKSGIDAIFFKLQKKPQRVYLGEWGECNNMQIYWKDDDCLVINSVEYEIE